LDFLSTLIGLGEIYLSRLLFTAGLILAGFLIYRAVRGAIENRVVKQHLRKQHELLIRKSVKWLIYTAVGISVLIVWGGSVEDIWVGITSVFGIIAIGFFAVWSILSNVVSGLVILLTKSFRLEDRIEVVGDGVSGTIENITLFHIEIKETEDHIVMIPNSVFLQKTVRLMHEPDRSRRTIG
jgi:small-conductance mechanosensitive channel